MSPDNKKSVKESEPFDVAEYLKLHLNPKNWTNYRQQNYEKDDLMILCDMAIEELKTPVLCALATCAPPCRIVGDIHGQYIDLLRHLNGAGSKKEQQASGGIPSFTKCRWVFLGDYIDRGSQSLETIVLILCLKIVYPTLFTILRGNHETKLVNFAYGFREEIISKLKKESTVSALEVWDKFNEVFTHLPLSCLVGEKILCMHGGISPELKSLNDIKNIKMPFDDSTGGKLGVDLLWADPLEAEVLPTIDEVPRYLPNRVRGLSVSFNKAAVKDTCAKLNINLIVRAHQMIHEGFKFFADQKMMTIFSAPRYMNETNNYAAVVCVAENGKMNIVRMKNSKQMGPTPAKTPFAEELTRPDVAVALGAPGSARKSVESVKKTLSTTSSSSTTTVSSSKSLMKNGAKSKAKSVNVTTPTTSKEGVPPVITPSTKSVVTAAAKSVKTRK